MDLSRPGEVAERLRCCLYIFPAFSLCFEALKCVSWGPAYALLTVPFLCDDAWTWEGDAGLSKLTAQYTNKSEHTVRLQARTVPALHKLL